MHNISKNNFFRIEIQMNSLKAIRISPMDVLPLDPAGITYQRSLITNPIFLPLRHKAAKVHKGKNQPNTYYQPLLTAYYLLLTTYNLQLTILLTYQPYEATRITYYKSKCLPLRHKATSERIQRQHLLIHAPKMVLHFIGS